MDLPKYKPNNSKGEAGLTIVKKAIEKEFNWIFRRNAQEHDFGIDAYIDVVSEAGNITGKSIALQIKTGASYFSEPSHSGWIYRDSISHLNYYLNLQIPIIILLVDDVTEDIYWCLCDANKTESAGDNWKITIPVNQKLNAASKSKLLKYVSPVTDYVTQLEHRWAMNEALSDSGMIILSVDKESINNLDFRNIIQAFERFEANDTLILKLKGQIDVAIEGYDYDMRELYEIPEVAAWIKSIFPLIQNWGYFLSNHKRAAFLRLLYIVHTQFTRTKEGTYVNTTSETVSFLVNLFKGLNAFCKDHHFKEEIALQITNEIVALLIPKR